MCDVKRDVEEALKVIKKPEYGQFSKYCKIYPFTTERILNYFELLDFNNKKILTVAGSGDHILNAIYMGAKEIDSFDINALCKYYIYLKIASIKALNYEQFRNYTLLNDDLSISHDIDLYDKVRESFSSNSEVEANVKSFWDNLYNECDKNNLFIGCLFREIDNINKIYNSNNYLVNGEDSYNQLKDKINDVNITFKTCNVNSLKDSFNNQYDLILLSNIMDYLETIFNSDYKKNLRKLVLEYLPQLLAKGGKTILYSYFTIANENSLSYMSNDFYKKLERNEKIEYDDIFLMLAMLKRYDIENYFTVNDKILVYTK